MIFMQSDDLDYIQEELDAIQRTMDYTDKIRTTSINELSFKIMKELNSHDPNSGMKIYSRLDQTSFNKYPDVFIKDIQKNLDLPSETIVEELKSLFVKRYVDFNLPQTEKIQKALQSELGLKKDTLKRGLIFENNFEGVIRFRLTERGFLALMDFSINQMQTLKEELEILNDRNSEQLNKLKQLDVERQKGIQEMNEKITYTDNKIDKFNENIFTIFSLMIAVFAVIGININSVPKIQDNFLENILVLNFSLCFSLVVLFYLLNTLIYKEKNNVALTVLFLIFVLVFLVLGLLKFVSTLN